VKGKDGDYRYSAYTNYYNIKEGIVLGYSNHKNLDILRGKNLGGSANKYKALPNSEIFWHQYKQAAEHVGRSPSDLHITKIVGYAIVNDKTKEVVKAYVEANDSRKFSKGSDGYYALLGTPAANGKAYFLEQHKNTFGNKEITAIEAKRGNSSGLDGIDYFVYHIDDKQ
jgi:hypothetical protein